MQKLTAFCLQFIIFVAIASMGTFASSAAISNARKNTSQLSLELDCISELKLKPEHAKEVANLEAMLSEPVDFSADATVDFLTKMSTHSLVFVKFGETWRSLHHAYPDSFTGQGDIRYAIAALGPELAWMIGFRAKRNIEGTWIVTVPSLERWRKFILAVNPIFKDKLKTEPIAYMPVPGAFESADKILMLSLDVTGDTLLAFPFAENDVRLVMHEVSFHLGAILLNRNILLRAYNINLRTQQLINELETGEGLGEFAQKIIEQLQRDRVVDLDFGTGNPTAELGHTRMASFLKPYSDPAYALFGHNQRVFLGQMACPEFTPTEAVVARMIDMLTLNEKDFSIFQNRSSAVETYRGPSMGLGLSFVLPLEIRDKIIVLLQRFITEHSLDTDEVNVIRVDKMELGNNLISTLDARIRDITTAAIMAGFDKPTPR